MPTTLPPADQLHVLRHGVGVVQPERAFVVVEGAAAEGFLQNLLSQELRGMAVGAARSALLLTPKARVIADPRVTRAADDRFLLDLDPVGADALLRGLVRYRLGAKVTIEASADWALVSLIGPECGAIGVEGLVVEATLGDLPRRDVIVRASDASAVVAGAVAVGAVEVAPLAVEALRVDVGEVRLGADVDERWMPAEVGIVERTVSFDKGCFIGQEPVTRLHRRGHANRGPRRLHLDGPVAAGEMLLLGEREVGVITSVAGPPWLDQYVAIGIVRVDVADDAELSVGTTIARSAS